LSNQDVRKSMLSVLECLIQKTILKVLFAFLFYLGIMLFCLNGLYLWDASQAKNALIWTLVIGLVSIFKAINVNKSSFFKGWLLDNFKITVLIGFFVSFYTFSIITEIIFQPFIALIVMMSAFSKTKKEHQSINKLCNWILSIVGILMVIWTTQQFVNDPRFFLKLQTFKDFYTPILLSIFLTPFLYGLYIYAVYERVFLTLQFVTNDKKLFNYMKTKAIIAFRTDTDFLDRWKQNIQLNKPKNKEAVNATVSNILQLRKIEKNPPSIPASEGWSPYSAQKFLERHEIFARDYQEQSGEWYTESPPLKIGNEKKLSDIISYCIFGNIHAVKRLQLNFNVNHPDNNLKSEKSFSEIAITLYKQAINEEPSPKFIDIISSGEGEVQINNYLKIDATKDTWNVGEARGYGKIVTFKIQ